MPLTCTCVKPGLHESITTVISVPKKKELQSMRRYLADYQLMQRQINMDHQ